MNLNFKENIPADFNDSSRVWIYQSDRPFHQHEAQEMQKLFSDFIAGWNSHGAKVKGFAGLLFEQFIVLMADETATGVSGCSTDSSVRLVKSIEVKFNVSMFERQALAFIVKDKIELLPLNQLDQVVENNFIDRDTLYFNNTVLTKRELMDKWLIPVKESWLARRISFQKPIS